MKKGNQIQYKKLEHDPFWNPIPKNTSHEPALPRNISGLIKSTQGQSQNYYQPLHGFLKVAINTTQP